MIKEMYKIKDKTADHRLRYIGADKQNCEDKDAKLFESADEAFAWLADASASGKWLSFGRWPRWAEVVECVVVVDQKGAGEMKKYTLVRTKGASMVDEKRTITAESYEMACKIFGVNDLAPGIIWHIECH